MQAILCFLEDGMRRAGPLVAIVVVGLAVAGVAAQRPRIPPTVIEGHGDVNTWAGFRDYTQFKRALLDAAKPKFPAFAKEDLLPNLEYGGTPLSRAVINVNIAFQELGKRG
jgi:hypothetical protein